MRWLAFDHIFFDCDSTLTGVEGIDALADTAGKGWRVSVLTQAAMNGDVDLEEVYAKRLQALRPTRGQIQAIRRTYKQNVVADAAAVIAALQALGQSVYIISGGLAEPVIEFGLFLGVPREHIRAVAIEYNALAGEWWQSLGEGPNTSEQYLTHDQQALTVSDGKAQIIREIVGNRPGRSLLIGDGVSDLQAGRAVDLFVAFGGVVCRTAVCTRAPVSLRCPSLAPILALASGPAGLKRLENGEHRFLVEKICQLVTEGELGFRDEQLEIKFSKAWNATYQAVYPWPDGGSARNT